LKSIARRVIWAYPERLCDAFNVVNGAWAWRPIPLPCLK
jgi:hypothetical protein